MIRRATPVAAAVVLGAVLATTFGCGIGVDERPRALQVTSTTTTTTTAPSTGRIVSILYYVNEGSFVPASTELPDNDLATVIRALLMPPPSTLGVNGTLSSIPAGTELLSLSRDTTRLTINLSAPFDNVVGLSRQQAIGQMVLTVTERAQFDAIDFQVEGKAIQVSSPSQGDTPIVTACDFAPLLATTEDASSASLSEDMAAVLAERRNRLDEAC